MKKRRFKSITSLTILSLLGQPLVGLAPHLVIAETIESSTNAVVISEDAVNLAFNKEVTYTSQWDSGGPAVAAVDGNEETFWRKKQGDEDAHLIVDLGEQSQIEAIEVLLYTTSNNGPMNEFTLEYSTDLLTWETVVVQTENLNNKELFTFAVNEEARYVRFSQDAAPNSAHGLYELRVWGNTVAEETPPVEKENIALGKTAQATTDLAIGRAANIIDNDPATYWRNLSRDEAPSVTLDLGENHQIDEIELMLYLINVDRMQEFTLKYSPDGETWETVAVQTEDLVDGQVLNFAVDAEGRYVRFSHTSNGATNGLYEMRVFGSTLEEEEAPPVIETGRDLALNQPTEHSTQWGSGGWK